MHEIKNRFCILLGEGFDDIEALSVIDLLRRANITVDIYGIGKPEITSHSGVRYSTDAVFFETEGTGLKENEYAGLFLPGGPGVAKLLENERIIEAVGTFHRSGKLIYAICGAPLLLAKAGILTDREYTCLPSVALLITAGTRLDKSVVVSGNIVTAKALGASIEGALTLIEHIASKAKKDEIASYYHI
jgi:4-methyl-5(b-hydroxyethyl)-thiazole monophosphate biosynthesis